MVSICSVAKQERLMCKSVQDTQSPFFLDFALLWFVFVLNNFHLAIAMAFPYVAKTRS